MQLKWLQRICLKNISHKSKLKGDRGSVFDFKGSFQWSTPSVYRRSEKIYSNVCHSRQKGKKEYRNCTIYFTLVYQAHNIVTKEEEEEKNVVLPVNFCLLSIKLYHLSARRAGFASVFTFYIKIHKLSLHFNFAINKMSPFVQMHPISSSGISFDIQSAPLALIFTQFNSSLMKK